MRPLDAWGKSRAAADNASRSDDPVQAAKDYIAAWPNHPPEFFQDGTRHRQRRARIRAWGNGDGWASKLVMGKSELAHFTLHAGHLDLDPSYSDPRGIFEQKIIDGWKRAIRQNFTQPLHWNLEIGEQGRLHAHIIGSLDDAPHLDLARQRRKPCGAYLEQVVAYQYKPSLPYKAEFLALYWEAKRTLKRLPNTSGVLNFSSKTNVTPYKPHISAIRTPSKTPSVVAPNRHLAPPYRPPSNYRRQLSTPVRTHYRAGATRARAPPNPNFLVFLGQERGVNQVIQGRNRRIFRVFRSRNPE